MSKQVIMNAEIKFHFNKSFDLSEACENDTYLDIGYFEFRVGGKNIPFGFDADSFGIKDNVVSYETGSGFMFNDFDISEDVFDGVYAEFGLTRADITAGYLSKADEINEFYLNIEDTNGKFIYFMPEILSVCFSDENGNQYPVSAEVLNRYNEKIRRECNDNE